jgi:transposase InsO family protein
MRYFLLRVQHLGRLFLRNCSLGNPRENAGDRYHRTIQGDCIRAKSLASVDDARQAVKQYVHHYNTVRLHSAIGYVTPHTKLAGKEKELFAQRDKKLEAARER